MDSVRELNVRHPSVLLQLRNNAQVDDIQHHSQHPRNLLV